MAERVDAEGAVLEHDDARDPRNQKRTQRRLPTAPGIPDGCWKNEGDDDGDPMDVAMLPADPAVLHEIGNIIEGRERLQLEQQPANMRMEKAFADVIRVLVVI